VLKVTAASPPRTLKRIAQLKDIQRRSLRRERPARRGRLIDACTNTPLPGWMLTTPKRTER
jgi:hypothetical protein